MITYLIRDLNVIKKLTGKDNHNIILLHLNKKKKEATYQSDYTSFELTEKLNYNTVITLIG